MKRFALAFTCLMIVAQPAAAETASEIEAWYRSYGLLWETTDVDLDAVERYYAHPGYFVQPNGTVLAPTLELHKSRFVAAIADRKQKGWTGTKLLEVKATMLSPSAALIEADWTWLGANGIPLDGCRVQAYSYWLRKRKKAGSSSAPTPDCAKLVNTASVDTRSRHSREPGFRRKKQMADYEVFELGPVALQCGLTLPQTKLAYKTYGELNAARDNVIVMPTFYGGQIAENETAIAAWHSLDPKKYFIVVPNLFGNGLSSSPSNTPPPFDRAVFPNVTVYDNVVCQHRLLTERLGVRRIKLVVGFSMGGQQAYQWAALYPDMVEAIAPICGSARTSPHNYLFLEGVKAALTADAAFAEGWYQTSPVKGLRAFARVYMGWAFSQDFFREHEYRKMGLASLEDSVRFLEGYFRRHDANDLLAMLWTWQNADLSANYIYKGDFTAALRAIKARAIVMPGETDLYFRVRDNELEVAQMPNAELRPIPSSWGHVAGLGVHPPDNEFIDARLKELLQAD